MPFRRYRTAPLANQWRRKLMRTLPVIVVIVSGAIAADYVFNVLLLPGTGHYTPLTTAAIGILVGAPISWFLISQRIDIEAVKEQLAESIANKERAVAEAEAALAVKSDFLANMTHELRTPLNAIIGFTGLLRRSSHLVAEDARKVALAHEASETLLRVVNDVLDFSKLEAGAIELDRRPFDPLRLAESVRDLLADQAETKGLVMSVVAEGLDGRLLGDDARLRQVLLNFASNAIKFTPQGVVTILVSQRPEGEERRLRVEVRDTGVGVPTGQLGLIFERFTQADASVSRQYGGTGLGLAICKRIIEAVGGAIGVESPPGGGSIFWFEVTLSRAVETDGAALSHVVEVRLDDPLRILVVDDNAVNRELVLGLLAPFDAEVETAEDGIEAIKAADRGGFDLILMDVQMPNMDGLTATRRIRAHGASCRVPIIAMTANVLPEQVARCLEAGMDDHLGKPIDPHALIRTLNHWASNRDRAVATA